MRHIKIAQRTREVLREHKISESIYNQFDKYEKIAFSTQLRRWGRISSPHLTKKLLWITLAEVAE